MKTLAFDTATDATTVALMLDDGTLFTCRHDPDQGERPGHASLLLPFVNGVLAEAKLDFAVIDRIAVGVGPGGFTGLRIGLAAAKALAQSLAAPLVGVCTLQALAAQAAKNLGVESVLAITDARRGELYVGGWSQGRQLFAPQVVKPEDLTLTVEGFVAGGCVTVGSGAVIERRRLLELGCTVAEENSPLHRVSAETICQLATHVDPVEDGSVQPIYLRLPDAEISLRS